jgi:hypothetical protein
MKNKKKENSVRSLISLYTVVMGVALSLAITKTIDADKGLESVSVVSVLLLIAFIVTSFPFYHGALRHLDDAYIENTNDNIKDIALVFDVLLLLIHGIGFVVLSLLIHSPNQFAWVLLVLLWIDVVWGVFAHFGSSSNNDNAAEWKWTVINFIFVALGLCVLVYMDIGIAPMAEPLKLALLVMVACILRTMADYGWAKDFYFPPQD